MYTCILCAYAYDEHAHKPMGIVVVPKGDQNCMHDQRSHFGLEIYS